MSPDICMCPGERCAMREECFRFKARVGDEYAQSWFMRSPVEVVNSMPTCEYFMGIAPKEGKNVRP